MKDSMHAPPNCDYVDKPPIYLRPECLAALGRLAVALSSDETITAQQALTVWGEFAPTHTFPLRVFGLAAFGTIH